MTEEQFRIGSETKKVLYAGFLPVFGATGSHPQFHHIAHPPAGYEFVRITPGNIWETMDKIALKVESGLSAVGNRAARKEIIRRIRTGGMRFVPGLRKSGHSAPPEDKFCRIRPGNLSGVNHLISSTVRLAGSLKGSEANMYNIMKFIITRDIFSQVQIPKDVKLVFLPSYPFILGQVPWVIEIEEPATLFKPFVLHEETNSLDIFNTACYPMVKSLLESENCRGIICHIKSTAEGIPLLFRNEKLRLKIHHIPLGVQPPSISSPRKKREGNTIRILFTNSWHQAARSFYLRGGLDLLEAFSTVASRYRNLRLIMRTELPPDLDGRYRKIIEDCPVEIVDRFLSFEDMHGLVSSADIYALPSARVHVISILQAMANGLAIVASDGWGITEYIEDGRNGIIVRGRYGKCSRMDENGMLREDYSSLFTANPAVVRGLTDGLSALIEDKGLRERLGASAMEETRTRFSLDNWNRGLANVFDGILS